ncbi:MAG: UvrD-helicase domain-containing protein [Clostridia bacterium]|nr:UvrD-helicase domain-containing protein [Clostridia bacterium]
MRFSDDQIKIINDDINNILVSAAAGSGKTTVLVERIITKILAGEYNIDELLVVTFTNEAAENMRKKISSRLNGKLKELKDSDNPDFEQIRRLSIQIDKLPNAYIQTINSFCARVIKEKGYSYVDPEDDSELIEPGIPIIDDNTKQMLLMEAVNDSLIETYGYYAEDRMIPILKECFDILVESNGDGRNDMVLKSSLEETYKKLRSIPDYLNYIVQEHERRCEYDDRGEIVGLDYILNNILSCAHKAYDNIDKAIRFAEGIRFISKDIESDERRDYFDNFLNGYKSYINEVITVFESEESSYADKFSVMNKVIPADSLDGPQIPKASSINTKKDYSTFLMLLAPVWEFIDKHRKHVCQYYKALALYKSIVLSETISDSYLAIFRRNPKELLERQMLRNKQLYAYIHLLTRVDYHFARRKKEIHGMDFSDQEHFAYAILKNEDARDYYREKFKEIYIDEYQDNSKLQDGIIELFSRGEDSNTGAYGNVFRVGDIKQSIYKFRYASPDLFSSLMKKYSDNNGGILRLLNNNYRSDETIIDFVNMIFEQLLSEDSGMEITYDQNQKLVHGAVEKNPSDSSVEIPLCKPNVVLCSAHDMGNIDRLDNDSVSRKKYLYRQAVLNEVIKYRKEGFELKDICILTRSNKTALIISQYLNKAGFPSKVSEKRELFDDNDIKGLTNLLITIGNQYRDEYLLGVLLSDYRFSNFTLDEVATVISYCRARGMGKNVYLIDKLKIYAEDEELLETELSKRINKFIEVFNRFRLQNIMTDIGILIENIYIDSGVRATLANKGKAELDKLIIFKDFLCTNFLGRGSDIAGIASDLEKMQLKLSSEVSVKVDDTSENKIRCMTCHSSKGLEFPCVILAEMVTDGNVSNNTSNISFDGDNGFIVKDYVYEEFLTYDSLENIEIKDRQRLSTIAEELRLLYVALTRAKNRLSVVIDLSVSKVKDFLLSISPVEGDFITKSLYLGTVKNMRYAMTAAIARTKAFNSHFDEKSALDLDVLKNCTYWYNDTFTCEYYNPDEVYKNNSDIPVCYPEKEELIKGNSRNEVVATAEGDNESEEEDSSGNKDYAYFEEKLRTSENMIQLHAKSFDEDGKPEFDTYRFEDSTSIPFKVSVTQLKNEFEVKDNVSMNLELPDLEDFIETEKSASSASEIGTFVHSIMRYINLKLLSEDADKYDEEIERLVKKGLITESQIPLTDEFKPAIIAFANTDICKDMNEAMINNQLYKEKPIVFSVDVGNDDYALVQGVIDMFYIDSDNEAVLVDYKTDNLKKFGNEEGIKEEAIRRHKVQIDYYSAALNSSGIKVKKRYLCLLRHNIMVEL